MESYSKIWIVSEIYYPVKTSTGYYVTEIAEYLAEKGLDVHVICTALTYNAGEVQASLNEEVYKNVKIHRIQVPLLDKNNFLKRLLRLLISSFRLFFKVLSFVQKGDKVLVVTNPAFLILMMPFIAWRKKTEYTILVHDIFPENLVAIKKISSSSCVYKLLKIVFDKAYSKAVTCISIGRDMCQVLEEKTYQKTRVELIPIWSQNTEVYPKLKSETNICTNLGLNNKFIFQFAGNLGYAQGIENLLQSIKMIENVNIHFLFIGGGAKYTEIENFVKSSTLQNISLIGFQDRSKQNDFLNACDVGIVTLSDGMYGLGVPSKSYNIMAAGKPILYVGEADSEIALCIQEYNIGWVVEPNNPQALCDMIISIYEQRDNLEQIGKNARLVAETVYAKNIILEKYYSYFTENKTY